MHCRRGGERWGGGGGGRGLASGIGRAGREWGWKIKVNETLNEIKINRKISRLSSHFMTQLLTLGRGFFIFYFDSTDF